MNMTTTEKVLTVIDETVFDVKAFYRLVKALGFKRGIYFYNLLSKIEKNPEYGTLITTKLKAMSATGAFEGKENEDTLLFCDIIDNFVKEYKDFP